jgi:cytochrome P450
MSTPQHTVQPSAPTDVIDSFDPWTQRLDRSNIWAIYQTMRASAPAVYSGAGGFWLLTRYADVKRAALNPKIFSSAHGSRIGIRGTMSPPAVPIEYDPPESRKFRNEMIAPFTAARIDRLSGLVDGHVRAAVAHALEAGKFDIVHDIAAPLAIGVISDVIGFDDEARHLNRELALAVVGANHEAGIAATTAYNDFLADEVTKRIETPTPGFLGELVTRSMATGEFDPPNLMSIARSMALAGHHTTINGASSMLLRYADPAIRERWLSDPESDSVISGFVEETLRIDPPIHMEARWTTQSIDVDGVTVPAGNQVALVFASANRDESAFEQPEEFIADRRGAHLAFGHGVHTCLGMALARLEMGSLLKEVIARIPRLRLDGEPDDIGIFFGHHMGWGGMPAAVE